MACCGEEYINTSASVCCHGPELEPKAHVLENRTVAQKCCWTKLIQQDEECCNGVGFDPQEAVCSDRAPRGFLIQVNHTTYSIADEIQH